MTTQEGKKESFDEMNTRQVRTPSERDLDRFATRVTRALADIDYFRREPLGWREGTAVVWAGMRGAVTVAAAQTLPGTTPMRSVLVLVAYAVAAMSLLVQGGTIGPLMRRLTSKADRSSIAQETDAELTRIMELMRASSETVKEQTLPEDAPRREQFNTRKTYRLAVIAAQRSALLDARDNGTFDADVLENALANLDADEIAIQLRGKLAG